MNRRNGFEEAASASDKEALRLRSLESHYRNKGQQLHKQDPSSSKHEAIIKTMQTAGHMAAGREFEADMTRAYGRSGQFSLVKAEPSIGVDPTTDNHPTRKLDLAVKDQDNAFMLVEFKRGHKAFAKDFAQMDTLDLNTSHDEQATPVTVRYHFQAKHSEIDPRFLSGLAQMNKNPLINVRARSGSMVSDLNHDVSISDFDNEASRHPEASVGPMELSEPISPKKNLGLPHPNDDPRPFVAPKKIEREQAPPVFPRAGRGLPHPKEDPRPFTPPRKLAPPVFPRAGRGLPRPEEDPRPFVPPRQQSTPSNSNTTNPKPTPKNENV